LNTDFTAKYEEKNVSGQIIGILIPGADLSGVDFRGKNLKVVIFSTSNVDEFNMEQHSQRKDYGVNLSDANFSNVDLAEKNLSLVNFNGANFSGADLSNSDLRYSDLSGANLESANLQGTLLDNAILTGANLKCINHPICNS
jgi:uncharacterized protein YjbI with pentapeptide repeats